MEYRTTSEAKDVLDKLRLSAAEQREAQRYIALGEANDQRAFERVKAPQRERLAAEDERLSNETANLKDEFWAITREAGRPDSDSTQVAERYAAAKKRASALRNDIAAYADEARQFNADVADPQAFVDEMRRKWAKGSPSNADAFLNSYPF